MNNIKNKTKEEKKKYNKVVVTKKQRVKTEKGITILALVITVIVLLIIAGVTIASLTGDNGILINAQDAKLATELSKYQEELELYKVDKTMEDANFEEETLTAGKTDLNYNTKSEEEGNIKTIITDITDEYFEKLEVIKGKLLINTQDKHEIKVAQKLGIEVNPYDIRDGVLWSSNGNLLLMDENTGSLTIPDSITAIGEGAFSNVEGLKTIIIPPTVKRIEKNAFKSNTTLENVIIQERNGEGMEYIGDNAFYGCTNLKSINLPDTITYIGECVFRFDSSLDNVKLPNRIKTVKQMTFQSCSNLKNLELSEDLEELGAESLEYTALTTLKMPQNLKTIGSGALSINTLLEIDTSESDYYEYKNGILYTKDLKTLVIGLPSITFANIETSVETIKGTAFSQCSKLSAIHIPQYVKTIEYDAFRNANLKSITVDSESNYFKTDENNNLYNKEGTTLYRLFDTGNVTIKSGVENIVRGALIDNGSIKTMILPDSFIGNATNSWGTFPTLDYLFLPEKVNAFDKAAYFGVKSIEVDKDNPYFKSINNEYILNKTGTELYCVKSDLSEINIPDTVEVIKTGSFMYQTGAIEVKLPNSVKKLEAMIMSSSNISRIEIQSNIEGIDSNAFYNANNLKEVVIHKEAGTIRGAPWGNIYGDRAIIWEE